jgi:UDP-glucose 4-epimerase
MRVLVTGGVGFVGSHVVEGFLGEGHEVWVLGLEQAPAASPRGARFVHGSIVDREGIDRLFSEIRPDLVSHHAAVANVTASVHDPLRDAEVNVMGSLVVLQACVRHGVQRLIFASTGGAIYGDVPAQIKARVDSPVFPMSPYACSKLAVEYYLRAASREHGLRVNILRYGNVYGPRQSNHGAAAIAIFCAQILRGEPITITARREAGDEGCIRDYVYVRDCVRANVIAARGGLDVEVLNVCTGVPATTVDIARGLMLACGREVPLLYAPRRPGDVERSALDETEFVRLVGEPTALDEGLEITARWFADRVI